MAGLAGRWAGGALARVDVHGAGVVVRANGVPVSLRARVGSRLAVRTPPASTPALRLRSARLANPRRPPVAAAALHSSSSRPCISRVPSTVRGRLGPGRCRTARAVARHVMIGAATPVRERGRPARPRRRGGGMHLWSMTARRDNPRASPVASPRNLGPPHRPSRCRRGPRAPRRPALATPADKMRAASVILVAAFVAVALAECVSAGVRCGAY